VLPAGTLLAGKYRVDRTLGRGGMGVVVAATHVQLRQAVAIKLLRREYVANPMVVERFVREARAAAQLRNEHVCRVTDVGALDDGTPYLVMELLDGQDLARALAQHGPFAIATLVDHVLQACVGLAEAHAAGIIHRDIKLANLFQTQRPNGRALIKVLDFGIAKAEPNVVDAALTHTTAVLGTPGYMSPEQLRSSHDVDVRCDIWALGICLYELASGRRPFEAASITELALKVTMDPVPALPAGMPLGFAEIVYRCLAKEPEHRFPNVAALAAALAEHGSAGSRELATACAHMLDVQAQSAPIGLAARAAAPPPPTTIGASIVSVQVPPRTRSSRWGWGLGLTAVIATGVVTALIVRSPSPPASIPAAATPSAIVTPPPPPAVAPATSIDAAEAVPVAVDAAVDAPADAAIDAAPDVPIDAGIKKRKAKPRVRTTPQPEDLGGSRL
jgi:eukaryotic-like serine/threonine-protein kinase